MKYKCWICKKSDCWFLHLEQTPFTVKYFIHNVNSKFSSVIRQDLETFQYKFSHFSGINCLVSIRETFIHAALFMQL